MSHIWVTEIKEKGEWLPTLGCGLTREDGMERMGHWIVRNPEDEFRLRKYVREEGK